MRILFDARGVRTQSDGLSNYVRHILTWLLRIDGDNEYQVLLGPAFRHMLMRDGLAARPNVRLILTQCPFMGPLQHGYIPWLISRLPQATLYHYPHFDLPVLAHPRCVVTIHDLNYLNLETYFSSSKRMKRFYSSRTTALGVARARRILAVSCATKVQILKRFPSVDPEKIVVTYEGPGDVFAAPPEATRVAAFRRKYNLDADRYVLYVGTDRAHKNLGRVLEAYSRAREQIAGCPPLLLVGPLQQRGEVDRTIARWNLSPWVRRVGYLADEELPLVYQLAVAFVFCSLAEGFGIPLVEAMASGVPVITSNLSAMAEVAGDCAVLVDPFSIDSIAQGLCRILQSDALRQTLVAKGYRRVQQFRWELTARQTLEVYRTVGGERLPTARGRLAPALVESSERRAP